MARKFTRNLERPEDFYRAGSAKKDAMLRLRKEMEGERRRRAHILAKSAPDTKKKDANPATSARPKAESEFRGFMPTEDYTWIMAMCAEKNASRGAILSALVDCARKGEVFHMERLWTPLERKFYAAELRKQTRLNKLQLDREGKKKANDRLGSQHLIDPAELELQEEAGDRLRNQRPPPVPR